jgi:anti-anti-sigma regulatory factor
VRQVRRDSEDCETEFSGDICVVRLRGSLSDASAPRILRLIERIGITGSRAVLIDASLLSAINEDCAAALLTLTNMVRRMGGTISSYGASGPAADVLASIR